MGMVWICQVFYIDKNYFRKTLKIHNFELKYTLEKGGEIGNFAPHTFFRMPPPSWISPCGFALALQAEVPWQKCGPSWKELK